MALAGAALSLLAGLLGLLALLSPVAAQTGNVLVSNAGQGNDNSWNTSDSRSQPFTTGAAGATLSSVEIISADTDVFAVSLCTVDASVHPTSVCTVLTAPSSFAAGTLVFTDASSMTLDADTTYTLLITNTANVNLDGTSSDNEDDGGVTGWSIADNSDYETSSNVWTPYGSLSLRITIKGTLSASSNTAATGAPTITGTAQVGETLTAVTTGIMDANGLTSPTYTYQWIRANGTEADIASANSSTYILVGADLGKTIKVEVSFTDDASNAETLTSAATATVTAATVTPVSNVLVSNVGNRNSGEGSAVFDFAQAFTTGDNATGYTLTSIELRIEGLGSGDRPTPTVKLFSVSGTGTEEATFTGPPMLAGLSAENYAFTPSSAVTLLGSTTYWVVVERAGGWIQSSDFTEDGTSATGWSIANGYGFRDSSSTGAFTAATLGAHLIRVNGNTVAAANTAPTVATAILDQTATTGAAFSFAFPDTTFADADGDTLTYAATLADDTDLPSWLSFAPATRTFSGTPTAAETVSVKVTASDASESVSDTFDIVVSATADTTPPEVDSAELGASTTGDNLVITFDENLDQTAVSIGLGSAFSVTADGQLIDISLISGFDATVTLRASLSAPAIRQGQTVVVGYTDPTAGDDTVALQDIAGNDVASFTTGMAGVPAVTNNSTSIAPTGAPTITGTAQVGETLTAVTTGIMDANGLTSPTYTYQWIRANGTEADIASANSSTYTLDAADLGKTIKVKVSFTDDTSNAETLTSAATATVTAATGICSRALAVQTPLLAATSRTACADVTTADLASVITLNVTAYGPTSIDPADFEGLTGLTTLQIDASPQLTTVPDNAFAGLTALTTLDFSVLFSLTTLGEDAFAGLTTLTRLDLNFNDGLAALDADIFDGLTALEHLHLAYTNLAALDADIFDGLTALRTLALNDNLLTTLDADIFDDLTNLEELYLSGNLLTTLNADIFDGLTAMKTLGLGRNGLTTLDADIFDGLTALNILGLSANGLTTLDAEIFDDTAMETLALDSNLFTTLDADLFDGLTALTTLYLSSNLFTTLDAGLFGGLTTLDELYLDSNLLTTLDADLFDGLTALTRLDLQDNRLTALDADIFDGITLLERLNLKCNYFTALDLDIFNPFAATLTYLDLTSDSFTTPPVESAIRAKFPMIVDALLIGVTTCSRVTVSPTSLTVAEGATGTYTVALRAPPSDNVMVAISSDNSDVTLSPTTPLTFTASDWDTPQMVTVTAAQDSDDEDESATLILDPGGNEYDFVSSTALTVTVTDDDGTAVTGICSRTAEVQTALLATTGRATCSDVTAADLVAVTSLPVSNYSGTTLDPADFAGLTGLTNLEIDDSPQLTTVPNNAFAGLTALTTLNFWFFSLTTLGEDAFAGLTVLTSLDLNFDDSLAALDAEIFDGLTALEHLDLSRNLLTTLDADIFDGLTALSTLTLQDNLLTTLDEDIFEDLTDLETLYLTSNLLTTLNADIFDGLTALDTLDLGHNGLTTLDADIFDDLTALRILGLSVNGLTTLDADIFDDTAMETLALDSNLLTTLDADLFDGLTALNTLYLDSNLFTTLDADLFDGLTALTRLELQDNRLTALDADIFDGITLLERLDLECNYFTALDLDIFNPFVATLTYLNLMSDSFTTPPVESAIRAKFPMITDVLIGVTPCLRVTVSPTSLTVTEGATGTYTVALRAQPSGDVMVAISSDNPDVTVAPTTPLTFTAANWDTAQMVTVSAAQDPDQADEAATLILDPDGNDYDLVISTVLTVTVTDDDGTAVNNAPTVATMIPDQTATSGRALDYTFPADTFTDADGDTLTYTATLADDMALPAWLSFSAATRTFSGTPQAADVETVSVKVTASDGNGGSVSDTFDIVVSLPPDTSPTLVSNAGQGDTLSSGVTIDRAQAFTTSAGGTLSSVEIISADSEGDDATVSLCTTNSSGQPTSTCTALTAPSSFAAGTLVFTAPANTALTASTTYSLVITSPGDDSLFLSYTMSDNEDTGGATGWSIANVHDSKNTANEWYIVGTALRITIKGTLNNTPPTVATEIPNQTAMSGTAFSYQVPAATFTDADGDTLTYTATLADDSALPTWLTFSAATRAFSGTPQAADVGTVAVKVTASDGNGESVSDSFDIVVSVAMDTTGPRVASIVRQNPTVSPTNADSLTWRVTFSEAVSNVNAADFAVSGTTATVTAVAVSGLTGAYDVSASGGNLAALNATVTLAIAASHNIEDGASNSLTNTTPTGTNNNSYVVDNTAPSVTISGVPASSDAPFTATFTFPEAVTGFAVGDITLGNATASSFTVTSTTVYTALITPAVSGTVTVDVPANAAQDAAGNGNTAAARATSTYTGTAALPAITIAAGASPVTEGTSAVFTLSRTGSTTDALTVNVTVSEAGGDMVAASNEGARTVTFLANSATATLSVATVPDSIDEANSVVTATVSADTGSPASYSVGAPGLAMVTVRDDDSNITVPGAPTDLSASSGGNTRINLSWTAPGDDGGSPIIGYKIEVSPDGNANWTELVATGNTTTTYAHIGLAVGTTRHYRVSAINSVGAGDPSNIDDATVIITTVTLRTQSIPEGIGTAAVLVTLNQPAGDPLSVPWYTLNGDAVSPGDYTAGAGQLIIPSGATSATISITIIDDADAEATETVLVLLSPGEGYVLGGSGATLSILDDDGDGPAPIRATVNGTTVVLTYNKSLDGASTPSSTAFHLRVADNRASVDEVSVNGSEVTLTLASPVQAGQTVSLDYTQPMSNPIQDGSGHKAQSFTRWYLVTDSTITKPAITVPGAPTDLSASTGGDTRINLSWTAPGADGGSPITGYKIEVSPDGNANWTELVANTGNTTTTYAHSGLAVGTTRHYRVSAINSAGAGRPSNIDDATVIITTVTLRTQSIPEGIGTAAVLVTLNQPAGDPLSVPWYTLNGTAMSPGDYTNGEGTLIIPSGVTSATISITIIDDADAEATETVLVLLSPGEGYALGGSGATLSILDDDGDGPAPSGATVNGTTVVLTYNKSLDGASTPSSTAFHLRVADNRASVDEVSVNGSEVTLTLASPVPAGQTVSLDYTAPMSNPIQDASGNKAQSFTRWYLVTESTITGTVDTTAPRVASIVRQVPTSSPTNADSLTWRVTFSEAVSNVNAADFAVSGTTATVTAVAAVSGVTGAYDVTASGGDLAGVSATVTLTISSSHNIEDAAGNELTNTVPTGTNNNSYVVDNTAPTVTISDVPATSDAPFTATFTFPEAVTGFAVGDITLGNATASSFTVTSTTVYTALVTPTATGAVTVDVPANAAQDAAGNGNTAATRASSTYAVPAITIVAGTSPVAEGTPAVFTLSRTGSPTAALTVNVTVSETGGDMVAAANEGARTVTFLANSATVTLSIATASDSVDEANSVVTATISADTGSPVSYSVGTPASAMVTVQDNDTRGVKVSATALTVNEGTAGTYTVVLDSQPTANVTVTPSRTGSSDVTFSPATLTFTALNWNTVQPVTVTAAQDGDAVDDSATISHAVTGGDYVGVTVESVVVTVDDDETADTTAPRVASIVRETPTSSPTNADSLTWRVTFSEAVSNVDAADFVVSGTTATVTAVAAVSGLTGAYDVTASGGNLAGVSATVTLAIAASHNIQDGASNALSNTAPTGTNDNSYVVDNTAPTVTISGVPSASDAPFTATFTFPEAVTGFAVSDITLGNATASSFTVTSTTVYTALVTPTAAGAVTVDVPANAAQDAAGNGNTAATQASSTYAVPAIRGVTVSATVLTVNEGSMGTYTVVLDSQPTANVTVTPSRTGSSDVTFSPPTLTFTALNWNTVQPVTVTAAQDSDEVDDSATISHAVTGGDYAGVTVESVVVTVDDDETADTVPGVPTDLSASTGGDTRINLSWTAPGDDGGSPIIGYKIEVSPDGNANWTELVANTGNTTTTYAHSGLAAGTTRHYRVSAINSAGAGDPSNIDDATAGAITVITTGGGGGGGGGPTPSEVDFEWNVKRDIEELDGGNDWPTGLWSDGETLWIAENGQGADDEVYAYDLATGERVESREFALADTNRAPRGIWSDGETVWVSDSGRERLFAYRLADGERVEEREFALAAGNSDARGIWSDEETMWVLDGVKDSLFAYDIASGELLAEYALDAANDDPRGIWSDGVTIWVSDHGAKRLFAYRLPVLPDAETDPGEEDADDDARELERVRDEEFTELSKASNNSPRGIWSDGDVMYVADESDDRVYSYNMPDTADARLASLTLSGVDIGEFDPGRTEYEAVVADGVTATTVEAEAMQRRTDVAIDPPDADVEADGHQVALQDLGEITVTVSSADGSRTKTYRVRLGEEEAAGSVAGCLRGDIAVGFSLVVYAGGSIEDLVACAEGRNVAALYVLDGGEWVSYIVGAPEFVNRSFAGLFAEGLAALTPLIARSDGPASPDPSGDEPRTGDATQPWPACLQGEIAEGFNLVVYEEGSVGELEACAEGVGLAALYALSDGVWVFYIVGAPEFVNRSFAALFADGVPSATPLVGKRN